MATSRLRALVQARWRLDLGRDGGAALLPLFHDRLAAIVTDGLIGA